MSRSHRLTQLPEKFCGHMDACNLSQKESYKLQHTLIPSTPALSESYLLLCISCRQLLGMSKQAEKLQPRPKGWVDPGA